MTASSSRLTAGGSSGQSRYQTYHAAAQTIPIAPNVAKLRRHPPPLMSNKAIGTDSTPPTREPSIITPMARPRSRAGNQREKLHAILGKAPASPAPNRNRIETSEL